MARSKPTLFGREPAAVIGVVGAVLVGLYFTIGVMLKVPLGTLCGVAPVFTIIQGAVTRLFVSPAKKVADVTGDIIEAVTGE